MTLLAGVSRVVDRIINRGEGAEADVDPFGPPLSEADARRLLDVARGARFEGPPPHRAPIPVEGSSEEVVVHLRGRGARWCVLATPYGAWRASGRLGLYERHARAFEARGFGIAALEPPFHGARSMHGQVSGYGFVRADLGHTMRAMIAYAAELVALARLLREREGASAVVGVGLSVGGNAIGLAAALGAPFDALGLLAAADGPASFYGTGQNREARRRTLRAAGFDLPRVAEAFRPVQPSTYARPSGLHRLVFAIPREDGLVPAATQDAWRAAWGGGSIDLSWHGHGVALASPRVAAALADALVG